FSAEQFVENLLNEGSKVPCDETSDAFNNNLKLPPYYDEQLFKKGQEFFYRNIFGLFLSKFLGLIALLTLPSSVNILVMTNMSSTEMSAYKRYMATIFHMCLWYDEKFRPGSSVPPTPCDDIKESIKDALAAITPDILRN
ncbi:uncharacterized protein LOC111692857, partial [Anoplophora glabripennis]|uniref:uncharacterized protein LOC111692857 n=1 Tax=Anoplophora glabripennis TaxID=217634 RepID=UPI000C78F719